VFILRATLYSTLLKSTAVIITRFPESYLFILHSLNYPQAPSPSSILAISFFTLIFVSVFRYFSHWLQQHKNMAITDKFLAPGLMNRFRAALFGLLGHASCICAHLYKNLFKSFCSAVSSGLFQEYNFVSFMRGRRRFGRKSLDKCLCQRFDSHAADCSSDPCTLKFIYFHSGFCSSI